MTYYTHSNLLRLGPIFLAVSLVTGCGGNDGNDSTGAAPVSFSTRCAQLSGSTIPASAIGLPTTGAKVTSSTTVQANGSGPTSQPNFCKVLADISPVDTAAQAIKIQVNLPENWNAKAFHLGGGGFDGTVVTADGAIGSAPDQPGPLARGYTTFGSDGGHQGDHNRAFLNDEVLVNYSGDQLKKTRDAATFLMQQTYGKAATKTYFQGGSGGGREALYALQKQTQDYDGVIAYFPAWPLNEMLMNYGRISRALAQPGAYPNVAKQTLLYNAVLSTCDSVDGAADGIVSNVGACNFNVATLRCPNGVDTGDACLSDAQITGLSAYNTSLLLPYPVASGETQYPQYNVFKGTDLRGFALGTQAPTSTSAPPQPFASWIYDTYVKGWITRDLTANPLAFDPESPGPFQQRISLMSSLMDMNKTDLSTFRNKGGKLILVHGLADELIPSASTDEYYNRLVGTMGTTAVKDFVRYYTIPGYGHGGGTFQASWDAVSALESWVETATAPVNPVVRDLNAATANRTRPLCEYPTWPRYIGSGDVNSATSYRCVTQ